MKELDFKNWLKNEVASSTSCIASFARPLGFEEKKKKPVEIKK